jgi:hypothetical protein
LYRGYNGPQRAYFDSFKDMDAYDKEYGTNPHHDVDRFNGFLSNKVINTTSTRNLFTSPRIQKR